jgi:hypothetical protein
VAREWLRRLESATSLRACAAHAFALAAEMAAAGTPRAVYITPMRVAGAAVGAAALVAAPFFLLPLLGVLAWRFVVFLFACVSLY